MAEGTIIHSETPFSPENIGTDDDPKPRLAIRCSCTVTRETDGAVSVALQLGDEIVKAHQFRCEAGAPRSIDFTACFATETMEPSTYSMRVLGDREEAAVADAELEQVAYKDSAARQLQLKIQHHEAKLGQLRSELAALGMVGKRDQPRPNTAHGRP